MGLEKIGVEFEVKSKGAVKSIKETTQALANFDKELDKNREGMQLLDQLTGGAASQFKEYQGSVKGGIKAIKSLTGSFKGLKAAIISTGIGAIVVALGLIVAYWDDIKELVSGVSKEQEDLLATQQASVEQSQLAFDAINATSNTLKLQGKSERDILEMKKAQTDETILALEAQLETQKEIKKSQVDAAERNKAITQGFIGLISLPITAMLGLVDGLTYGLSKLGIIDEGTSLADDFTGFFAEMLFDPEEVAESADATIAETEKQLTKLKNQRDGYILQANAQDEAEAQKRKDKKQKEADEEAARVKAQQDKDLQEKLNYLQRIEDAENAFFDSKLAREDLEKNKVREKYFELIEAAKKYGQDLTVLEEAQKSELDAIGKKYDDEEAARAETLKQQRLAAVASTFGNISEILGKNSSAGKAAAIAQATINTFAGVSEVWRTPSTLPQPLATIEKVASSAVALAAGLKTVQQIKSVPKPAGVKGGGGSGGGVPGGAGGAPRFNIVGGNGGTNQLADVIAEQTKKPVRSYVVAGDVTTAQELQRNTVTDASL